MSDAVNLGYLFGLKGKVALVSGSSRGIGFIIARGLLEAGSRVYITARKAKSCQRAAGAYTKGAVVAIDGGTVINHQRMRTLWPEQLV